VVGFDGDRRDTFTSLAQWIEVNRLECATFHILTPYPGTPLFRQLDAERRLLHRNWISTTRRTPSSCRNPDARELELGYDWLYRRCSRTRPSGGPAGNGVGVAVLFRRRVPLQALEPALALSHPKRPRAGGMGPLVACARRRQMGVRRRLEARDMMVNDRVPSPL